VVAQRFKEAADNYRYLDQTLSDIGTELSLDNIQLYLLPKYRANYEAGRGDSARYMGQYILSLLDSAITLQKNSAIAELATIYDTNQKDAQIAQQQTLMARQRWISTLVALVLLTTFFIIYTLHRRRAQRHLAAAYKKLEEGNAKLSILNSQLTVANAKAEESSKMKTNFIQQISHEIRTPLNILSGFTQVITTPGMELDEETRSDINRQITENTDRITGLVNKMLELSDVSSQTVIERNDNAFGIQLAAQAADASGINDAGHLTFDMDIAPDSENTELKTNERQATRALALLLDNAIKFTKKGKVTLRINTDQQRNTLNYVVEDTGIGIPANEAEHIFEEFVQLDDYYDGTGIGLTVARSITRRLGGDIILDTTYTAGARFVMSLPL
jgi:signal transduction histidine kinase